MAVADGGRFLVIADDDGGLTCLNRVSLSVLWSHAAHDSGVCAVRMVGRGSEERILSVDRHGHCVTSDPVTGNRIESWRSPGCDSRFPHGHALEVSWDREHVFLSCLELLPPTLGAVSDAVAAMGIAVNVHDPGGLVVVVDPAGRELGRTGQVHRPFAPGRSTRAAYLRTGDRWVGVQDVVTGDRTATCPHCYERGGYAIAMSADERWVAWSGYEKYGTRMETREFVRLVRLDVADDYGWEPLRGGDEFFHLTFSEEGDLLTAADSDGFVSVVPLAEDGGSARLLGCLDDEVVAVAFADPGTVVGLGARGEIRSWDVAASAARADSRS